MSVHKKRPKLNKVLSFLVDGACLLAMTSLAIPLGHLIWEAVVDPNLSIGMKGLFAGGGFFAIAAFLSFGKTLFT